MVGCICPEGVILRLVVTCLGDGQGEWGFHSDVHSEGRGVCPILPYRSRVLP